MGLCVDLIDLGNRITSLVPLGYDGHEAYVVVDSCFVSDFCQYETMVFPADKAGNVICWTELDVERYDTVQEMRIGHEAMCKKWRAK